MSPLTALITILVVATLIPVNLSAPPTSETPADDEESSAGTNDQDSQPGSTSLSTEVLRSNSTLPVGSVFQSLSVVEDLLDVLLASIENVLTPLTLPLSFLLKGLLTPVIILVRILLLIVQVLLDFIVGGLVQFLIAPLLKVLGLGILVPVLNGLLVIVNLLLDRVSCLLGLLSYFDFLFPDCGNHRSPLHNPALVDKILAMYDQDVSRK
ncbi:uncharacterized protein [Fopius arisanus]|nr:PREDICTED: uncharacterized protein LOC105272571 isoform X2 [Fopius arisanus]